MPTDHTCHRCQAPLLLAIADGSVVVLEPDASDGDWQLHESNGATFATQGPPSPGGHREHVCPQLYDSSRHVYLPLHPLDHESAGMGTGPCQHPGCTAPAHAPVHGALDLGIST